MYDYYNIRLIWVRDGTHNILLKKVSALLLDEAKQIDVDISIKTIPIKVCSSPFSEMINIISHNNPT